MASSRVMATSSSANSDLTRQTSICSLPVADLQSSVSGGELSKNLGSMSMEELFRSICAENAAALGADGGASVSRQGSLASLKSVGGKTAEEVWREITTGRVAEGGEGPGSEMTLEDFLARAGAVAEEDVGIPSGSIQAGGGPNPVVGEAIVPPADDLVVEFVNGAEGGASSRGRKRPLLDPVDRVAMQRQKRMIKNRESAARSRERKQAYIAELESLVSKLEEENAQLLISQEQQQKKRIKQLVENRVPVTQKKRVRRRLRRTQSM